MYVDLDARQLLAAQKAESKIAVEIKSFTSRLDVDDLEKALGQYILYQDILIELEPELYLAVSNSVFDDVLINQSLLGNETAKALVRGD